MFKFKVFHTPKPRRFSHKPIYWDPEQEERNERNERIERELANQNGDYKIGLKRGSFRKFRYDEVPETQDMQRQRRLSNIRLLLIIIVLLALAAVLYITSAEFLAL